MNNYINKIKKVYNALKAIISKDYEYLLAFELKSACELRKYFDKDEIASYMKQLDEKVKIHALDITPAPLEVILRTEKFLPTMNLYLSKAIGKTYDDHYEAISVSIFQLKIPYPLYSFHQFLEMAEILGSLTLTKEERKAIKVYQTHPEYVDSYLENIDICERVTDVSRFMNDHIEDAILFQQLHQFFFRDINKELNSTAIVVNYKNFEGCYKIQHGYGYLDILGGNFEY